jgi:hypothetical protein
VVNDFSYDNFILFLDIFYNTDTAKLMFWKMS